MQKKQKQIINFPKRFILSKYHMFWLSNECFSILYVFFKLEVVPTYGLFQNMGYSRKKNKKKREGGGGGGGEDMEFPRILKK